MKAVSLGLALTASIFITSFDKAKAGLSDEQIQAGYNQALNARMAYQPERAEAILEVLVAERPSAPQLRFDLAVAQAEQGHCAKAARTFARGKDLAHPPSFERAAEIAMADLCPSLAPWETSVALNFGYDSNVNGGATSKNIVVNGVAVQLSDNAVAVGAFGYTANVSVAYNHQLSQTGYIAPSFALNVGDYEAEDYDKATATVGLSYRHHGDKVDWRIGPSFKWTYDHDGLSESGGGVSGRLAWKQSDSSGLYANFSSYDFRNERNPLNDFKELSFGATYVLALGKNNMVARAAFSVVKRDYRNEFQDLDTYTAEIGLSGSLTQQMGFDISLSHTKGEGRVVHPFFGVKRTDSVATLNAQASFTRFEGWYGRPYVGIQHKISDSNFNTKDYKRTPLTFGVTQSF